MLSKDLQTDIEGWLEEQADTYSPTSDFEPDDDTVEGSAHNLLARVISELRTLHAKRKTEPSVVIVIEGGVLVDVATTDDELMYRLIDHDVDAVEDIPVVSTNVDVEKFTKANR